MKKLLLVLILSFSMVFIGGASASAEVILKSGLDMPGKLSMDNGEISDSVDVTMGVSIGAEYLMAMSDQLYIGGGVEFQMKREVDRLFGAEFSYLPIYGLVHYYITDSLYLLGKGGYNFFSHENEDYVEELGGDVEGGLYYGFGAGFWVSNSMILEAAYTFHNGLFETPGYEEECDYSKIGISVGLVL